MAWVAPLAALIFACAAFLSIRMSESLCDRATPFEDGPAPGRPPEMALIAGAALIGLLLAGREIPLPALALAGVTCAGLAGAWYSDVRCGLVFDAFTLVPLCVVFLWAAVTQTWGVFGSAAVVGLPFATSALFSRGRGMGWGDVKLITLGGAVLGLETAMIAAAGACLIAGSLAILRKRKSQPIAFAPYLAGAIATGLLFPFSL